jgi:hypothetical protein
LWRQTKVKPQLLEDAPPVPPLAVHLWQAFVDMSNRRGSDGFAAGRLSAQNLRDWCWLNCTELELWERTAIVKLDAAWMEIQK